MKTNGIVRVAMIHALVGAAFLPGRNLARALEEETEPVRVLDLEQAQRFALDSNPTLRAAHARVLQAEARIRQAESTYWPTVGVGGIGNRSYLSQRSTDLLQGALVPLDQDALDGIDAASRQVVDEFGRANRNALRSVRSDVRDALQPYPELLAAEEQLHDINSALRQQYRSSLNSQLSDVSVSRLLTDGLGYDPTAEVDDTPTTYGAGVYGSWLLFDGFARRFARAVARYGEVESESARRDAQRLLLGAVAEAYYRTQLAREEITIAQADLEFNTRLLEDARVSNESGKGSLSTVLNFEVRRNAAESALLNAGRQFRSGMIGLAALLGVSSEAIDADTDLAPLEEETEKEMEPPALEGRIAFAIENRPDLAFARAAADQAEANIGLMRSLFYPSIDLTGAYGALRPDDPNFESDDVGGTISVLLRFDVFEGGRKWARLSEAKALQIEAQAVLAQTENQAVAEVRDTLSNLASAGDQLRLQRRNVELVERTRNLVELEYDAGHASLVRLNQAQRDLVETRSRYARALASLHVAWHDLLQATAQSLDSFPDD